MARRYGDRRPSVVLQEARAILAKRGAWTQKHLARTEWGSSIDPQHPDAVQFCAIGALCKVANPSEVDLARKFLMKCAPSKYQSSLMNIEQYNDRFSTKKKDIMKLYDCAIETAEAAGK